jgi:hypothetical protein
MPYVDGETYRVHGGCGLGCFGGGVVHLLTVLWRLHAPRTAYAQIVRALQGSHFRAPVAHAVEDQQDAMACGLTSEPRYHVRLRSSESRFSLKSEHRTVTRHADRRRASHLHATASVVPTARAPPPPRVEGHHHAIAGRRKTPIPRPRPPYTC